MLRIETLDAFLESALQAGFRDIGQIRITVINTSFSLCHVDDFEGNALEKFTKASDAASLALHDDTGKYRPLKSAPNLRHGWCLHLKSHHDLRLALDLFYPAAIGHWRAHISHNLNPTPLRNTLDRQSGMYRVSGKISDEQGSELIESLCKTGCLRSILWPIRSGTPPLLPSLQENQIPLLCCEACNIFVAEARKVAKEIPVNK